MSKDIIEDGDGWKYYSSGDISDNDHPTWEEGRVAEMSFKRAMEVEGYTEMRNFRYDKEASLASTMAMDDKKFLNKYFHVFYGELR